MSSPGGRFSGAVERLNLGVDGFRQGQIRR